MESGNKQAAKSGAARSHLKLSNAKEERKLRKPLIERKRRERINYCLEQLKETVVRAFQLDQSKLEKADILEMTVRHLENIQKSKSTGEPPQGLDSLQRFSTGYIQCMHELHTLLITSDWMDPSLGARMLNHLLKSLPKTKDGITKPQQDWKESHWMASSPALLEHDIKKRSACSRGDIEDKQTQCPFAGQLNMWRPW
ncbi:transcription cofactor HES-6-like [Spea bombifrons]|uniref:transcription cofactor HES-6-like n=1 Tax=Spea bombifrons TaxID=233779 RepID=UPI0023494AB5|nr:transcription cofactor HES-6-like [Spea bombifrons]